MRMEKKGLRMAEQLRQRQKRGKVGNRIDEAHANEMKLCAADGMKLDVGL